MRIVQRVIKHREFSVATRRCFSQNKTVFSPKYAASEAVVKSIIESSSKDQKNEKEDPKGGGKWNFSLRAIVAGIAGGVLFSASVATWDYIQEFVFSRAEKSLVSPPSFFADDDIPASFMEEILKSEPGTLLADVLDYPLQGEDASPHLRVVLGASGCGKSTTIRRLLRGQSGVIFVDMSELFRSKEMFRRMYSEISFVPSTDRSEEFYKDAVEATIIKQYKESVNDSEGNTKPYKIIVDSADDALKLHNGVETPAVIAWLIWLMEISPYANVIIVASDAAVPRHLNQILQIRSRHTVYKFPFYKNKECLKTFVEGRIDALRKEQRVAIEIGNLHAEDVVDAYRGLLSNYSNLFSLTEQFQNLEVKFNRDIEECKSQLAETIAHFPKHQSARIIEFMHQIANSEHQRIPERYAIEILRKAYRKLILWNFLAYDGNGYVTALPQYVYAFKELNKEGYFDKFHLQSIPRIKRVTDS